MLFVGLPFPREYVLKVSASKNKCIFFCGLRVPWSFIFEEEQQQLTEKERFELEKRLLKEQMKEQLLGRSAKPAAPAQAAASANKHIIVSENNPVGAEAEEEEKHHAAVKEEISGAPQTSDK